MSTLGHVYIYIGRNLEAKYQGPVTSRAVHTREYINNNAIVLTVICCGMFTSRGCETPSFILEEEHRMKVFENRLRAVVAQSV
jgi:hypothetical protein